MTDVLTPDRILLYVQATDKWQLIDQLVGVAAEVVGRSRGTLLGRPGRERRILESVVAVEKSRSTGMGHGCALPHARVRGLVAPVACLAVLERPIDFAAPDGELVAVVCLLLIPEDQPGLALKLMAELAAIFGDGRTLDAIRSASDPIAVYELIRACEHDRPRPVTARSIMRQPLFDIHPDTPLTEVTRLLHVHGVDAASVVDHDGTLVGEITCDLLFRSGMPEFLGQLRSVAFIKNFDPFDRYFQMLKTATAADVMSTSPAAVPETATLLEVIFLLAVRNHMKVFVVRDGKRVGVIDRSAVLKLILAV